MRITSRENQATNNLKKRLHILIVLTVLIPSLLLGAFIFFGPQVGGLFGFLSIYKNDTGNKKTQAVATPIFKNPIKAINKNTISISGFTDAGNTVKIFVNGPEAGQAIAANDGTFAFANIPLIKGRNTIFAKALNQQGNESNSSEILSIIFDDKKPELEVTSPKAGETVKNLNNRITLTGKVSEKSAIKVNGKFAILKPDLTFEHIFGVDSGEVEIKVEATDEAGNTEKSEFKIKYEETSQ